MASIPAASSARPLELAALLDEARALLARYEAAQADGLLFTGSELARLSAPALRLDYEELACEAALQRSEPARALSHAGEAVSLAQELGDPVRIALAQALRGTALVLHGRYHEATARLQPAIDSLRALGKEPLACGALASLGLAQERLGDFTEALATHEEAVALARQARDHHTLGRALVLLGEASLALGESDRARTVLGEALALVDLRGDQVGCARCRLSLARLAQEEGRSGEARALLEQSLAPAVRGGSRRTLAEVLRALGAAQSLPEEGPRALDLLTKALRIFEEMGARQEAERCHLALSDAHEAVGNFHEALRHHQLFARLRGEVLEDGVRAQLANLSQRHEREEARLQMELTLRDVELAEAHLRLAEQGRELESLARRDALTGLANRRTFAERMEGDFERARRYASPLTVARIDLDGLRAINETFSVAIGDEVLRRVAALFTSKLRNVDLPARYGEDDFAVILPETGPDGARLVCEKLRAAVEGYKWEAVAPGLKVTVCVGLASGTDLSNWELLLAAADAQLFLAKRAGKNQLRFPT